jgi:hypothetical protein
MIDKVKEADRQTMEAYSKVVDHFGGDAKKANEWFGKPNLQLKSSPINMVGQGKARELNQYIDARLRGKK